MSRNLATERDVSRIDDTNVSTLAAPARGRRIAVPAAQRLLVDAGSVGEPDLVSIGSRDPGTEPTPVVDPVPVHDRGARVGGVWVPAELGDVRLAPDRLGSRQCPVRERHLPGPAPNP